MGDLAITNAGGKTVMSFRIPSDAFHIDYVKMQKDSDSQVAAIKRFKRFQKKH